MRSHALAKDLLDRPDGFITATFRGNELIIEDFQKTRTHANIDDSVMHWALQLKECKGNIVR